MWGYNYQWSYEEIEQRNALDAMSAKVDALSEKLDKLARARAIQRQFISCQICGGGHISDRCPIYVESVQYVGDCNIQQNNFYSTSYNQDWSDHSNFSWCNTQWPSYSAESTFHQDFSSQAQVPILEEKPSFEDMFMQFMQSQASTLRNMEKHMGQIVDAICNCPQEILPYDAETNLMNGEEIERDSEEQELPNKSFEEEIMVDNHDEEVQEEKTQSDPLLSFPNKSDEYGAANVMENTSNEVFVESYAIDSFETSLISTSEWDNIDFIGCSKFLDVIPYSISFTPQFDPLQFQLVQHHLQSISFKNHLHWSVSLCL